jgi:hypothetical protein
VVRKAENIPIAKKHPCICPDGLQENMNLCQDGSHQEQEMNTRPFEYKTVPTTQLQHSVPVLVRLSFNYGSVVSYFHLLQNQHHGYMRNYVSCSLTLSVVTTKHKNQIMACSHTNTKQ